jgi:ATP-binding protein involved in chromosome partitioning
MSDIVVPAPARPPGSPLAGVKHVIAVGSGKGGVGKSTTAVNLAAALMKLGAKVGLMDADIYGPSAAKLLGASDRPTQDEHGRIHAPVAHGMKVMSMALLGTDAPVVWRGPMASKAVSQFLGEVDWGELDYLVVDLPPGTGDIQITLAQSARLSGALVVMTPQALAGDIAKRGLKMFQQVRIPVIGLVENMSEYVCPKCNHVDHIFRSGGAAEVSKELRLPVLGSVPIDPKLVEEGDTGLPVVLSRPDSEVAKRFLSIARNMAAELSSLLSGARAEKPVVLEMQPNTQAQAFKVLWSDGKNSLVTFKDLRFYCPCAACVDENTGKRTITREQVRDDIKPERVRTVGNYALSIDWSDGHNTGLYSYDYLRKLLVKEG